jgi:hypothetical protein
MNYVDDVSGGGKGGLFMYRNSRRVAKHKTSYTTILKKELENLYL